MQCETPVSPSNSRVVSGSRKSLLMARASRSFGMSPTSCRRLIQCGAPCVLFLAVAYLQAKFPVERDLDLVELFAGGGALAIAFTEAGLQSATFERDTNPEDDILTTLGWLKAVKLVLRLKVGGLLWSGTPCSSWVFVNRGTSRRCADRPMGDASVPSVSTSNQIVARVCTLLLLAFARGAAWAMEQPGSSLMPQHRRLQQLRELGCLLAQALLHCTACACQLHLAVVVWVATFASNQ